MNEPYPNLQIALQKAREHAGLSQKEAAERLQVSRQAISGWESGKSYPDIDRLADMARLYHVSCDQLLGCTDDSETNADAPESDASKSSTDTDTLKASADTNNQTPDTLAGKLSRLKDPLLILTLLVATLIHCVCGLIVSVCVTIYVDRTKSAHPFICIYAVFCFLFNLSNIYGI